MRIMSRLLPELGWIVSDTEALHHDRSERKEYGLRQRVGEVHDNDCPEWTPWKWIPVLYFGRRHGDSTAKVRDLTNG